MRRRWHPANGCRRGCLETTRIHPVPAAGADRDTLTRALVAIDESAALPLDFVLATGASKALVKVGRREAIPVVLLP